jgi:hypothetical protein
MAFDISPYLSSGRNVVSAIAGVALGVGITSVGGVSTGDLVAGFDHIFKGLNEIAIGVGIIAPAAMSAWAFAKGRLSSKVADVHAAAPHELVSAVNQVDHPQLVAAVARVSPATLVNAAAELPSVQQIIATPAMEKATASQKVVS